MKNKITVYIDENLPPNIKEPFQKMRLRTIEISKTKKYAGKKELDYIADLLSQNAVFVKGDEEFVNTIIDNGIKHAGIFFIPVHMEKDDKVDLAWVASGLIKGLRTNSSKGMHNKVAYPAHDGIHIIENKKDKLDVSWDWLSNAVE